MSTRTSVGRVVGTYKFVEAHRHQHSVQAMCRLLEIAPSGYYDWIKHPVSKRAQEDASRARVAMFHRSS